MVGSQQSSGCANASKYWTSGDECWWTLAFAEAWLRDDDLLTELCELTLAVRLKCSVEPGVQRLRMIGDVQHDPNAVDDLVIPALLVEQSRHIPVLARQAELPRRQLGVEIAVLLLPLLDVCQGADVDGLLEEAVDL